MADLVLVELTFILILGVLAQWFAWRFKLPSLLVLLLVGFLAGIFAEGLGADGEFTPDAILGDLMSPTVSLAIALLLFEAALQFSFADLARSGKVVFRLISIGAVITWAGAALIANKIADMSPALSILFGAIAVISGPSVIVPLLREMPLKGSLGGIVRSEGDGIEPIGVTLAVLVFGGILSLDSSLSVFGALWGVLSTAFVGIAGGTLAALILLGLLARAQMPDALKTAILLTGVIGAFTFADQIRAESGLITVTVMGMIFANQRIVNVRRFVEVNDNLRILFISALFIVLAARVSPDVFLEVSKSGFLVLLLLTFVIRPLAVCASSWRAGLTRKEIIFLSFIAPRGVIAAGLSSLFAVQLLDVGFPDADRLVRLSFFVILGTVAIYGLGTPIVARMLGVAEARSQGVLILGAHDWARAMAREFIASGIRVLTVDTNPYNVLAAKREGIPARQGNIFYDHTLDEVVLDGIGYFMSLTSNDEVNTLAALHFSELFGSDRVFQLPSADLSVPSHNDGLERFHNRILFGRHVSFDHIEERFSHGAVVRTITPHRDLDLSALAEEYGKDVLPFFVISKSGELGIFTVDKVPLILPESRLICLAAPEMIQELRNSGRIISLDRQR